MKQFNFKELNIEVGIDQYQKHDLRKEIGNALHRASESVPMNCTGDAFLCSFS